jgi:hypothetical protein
LLRFSDARNFGRTLTGLCLIAAPVIFLISDLIDPNTDNDNKVKELAGVAAHKSAYLLSGLTFLVGGILLMAAGVGVIRLFRGRKVGLGQVAGALVILGGAVTFAWYALGVAEYEMVNHAGLDQAALAKFLDTADSSSAIAPLIVCFALGTVLGLILLGIASWRRRIVPVWTAILMIVAGPLGFFAQGKGGGIAESVVLIVALGSLGLATLRVTDEEWDAPREQQVAPPAPSVEATPAPAPAV